MMNKNARILVAAVTCVLLGSGLPLLATESIPVIQGMDVESGPSGPVLHIRATGALETVHYSPQPGVWIVEMPAAGWSQSDGLLVQPGFGIERAELRHVEEFGKRMSRLTVWLDAPAQLNLSVSAGRLDLEFASFNSGGALPEVTVASEEVAVSSPAAVTERPPAPTVSAPLLGGNLFDVVPVRTSDGVVVRLKSDRPIQIGANEILTDPWRLYVDLKGVNNRVDRRLMAVNSPLVRQVRVAQHQTRPELVTRVVVDLRADAAYRIDESGGEVTITVGPKGGPLRAASSATRVFADQAGTIQIARAEPKVRNEPEPVQAMASTLFDLPDEPKTTEQAVPEPADDSTSRQAVAATAPERSPWVADSTQLIEQAPAAAVIKSPTTEGESYASTEVETEEQRFTGEPITLTLKDADIKDVLKTFSVLTDLNIVLDPSVSGSVTVELREVPWDQALDLILKINGLDYVLENNVLRVAPTSKLASERSARARLELEREKATPLKTVLQPVSYAKATDIATLLASDSYLLSPRGSVTVDARTNTLILRDTVDRMEGILRLIESLDKPTPQVVIEGRIVETTRDFSRELGVSWGFSGIMDTAHGNDTGLSFPNSVSADGRVDLPRGNNGVLSMTFGDILNTFNLDFMLTAAESDGLVRIVSTPRITTQNLQRASIRSGLQIPVQTIANNTVTVQYVDATLRLEVTPQITAEGTVNLEISIKKQEPVLAAAVAGGRNAPIFTRDAQTQLLVRDGGTTVIAGIYQINDQDNENRVPGLHKIPIIGWMFKNKGVFKRHDELLIFITPRIVKY
ncbi:MAG: type IV pilus secretin PilQ [Thermoanaerobaculales bacterium]